MKKFLSLMLVAALALSLVACSSETEETTEETTETTTTTEAVVETFETEYEMKGTTSSGVPKNDTFIFNGTTTDGIITELEFDVIRNKGLDSEYSKTELSGYEMNVTDATVVATDSGFALESFTSKGYSEDFAAGGLQFLQSASIENLTEETTFGELTVVDYKGEELSPEDAIVSYQFVANEAGIGELTADTLVKDLITIHGLHDGTTFVEGENRVSFEGIAGGRSYGEQIQAIEDYILANNMTLEAVYEMFQTVNQSSQPIAERDVVAGASITFVGDFQRMAYVAIHGEIFEGVVNHTENEDGTIKVEVVTQGFGGEIETNITFNADKTIKEISVRDHVETDGYGADILVEGSDYMASLLANGADAEITAGATVTSNALTNAITYAQEYVNAL